MNIRNINTIMSAFDLSELDVRGVIYDKDSQSQFLVYMTAIDHVDYASRIFKSHGINMYSEFDAIRDYTTLYQLLKSTPFTREKKQLFYFIANSLCNARTLHKDELF